MAVFNSILNKYTVTWKNYDGTVLDTSLVNYGTIPEFYGVPHREPDGEYAYVFTGWDPEIVPVTEDAEYIAQFNNIIAFKSADDGHTVDFKVGDFDPSVKEVLVYADSWDILIPTSLFKEFSSDSVVGISVDLSGQTDIPANLHQFVDDRMVVSLQMFVNGKIVSDFGTNEVTVSIHHMPNNGTDASRISVWYMNEGSLKLEEVEADYDEVTRTIEFTTSHFSYWLIGEKSVSEKMHDLPMTILVSLIAILALCVVLLRMKR
jgi:hypothetical protein